MRSGKGRHDGYNLSTPFYRQKSRIRRGDGVGTDYRVQIAARNAKTPPLRGGVFVFGMRSLTITYFHTGIRTIIGVESFHGPVRDGKGWDRLAMVIRHDLLLS
ncbi:hypothetical protein BTHE68_37520 [Burkholderia sp. THE68]|nr:hypothetical protein BTHE68_37520 [Burkholderia sp. THE68]